MLYEVNQKKLSKNIRASLMANVSPWAESRLFVLAKHPNIIKIIISLVPASMYSAQAGCSYGLYTVTSLDNGEQC